MALSDGDAIEVANLDLPDALLAESETRETAGAKAQAAAEHGARAEPVPSPGEARAESTARAASTTTPLPADLAAYLDAIEREMLVLALERHHFNRTAAGASMGLSLRQMRYRMARLGVVVDGDSIGADGP